MRDKGRQTPLSDKQVRWFCLSALVNNGARDARVDKLGECVVEICDVPVASEPSTGNYEKVNPLPLPFPETINNHVAKVQHLTIEDNARKGKEVVGFPGNRRSLPATRVYDAQ